MNPFFLPHLIIRLISILIMPLVMLCFVAIVIGKLIPTQLITLKFTQADYITLFDMNRRVHIPIQLPVSQAGLILLSGDGHRVIMEKVINAEATFSVWDIFTGRIVHLVDTFPNCNVIGEHWVRGSRYITFSCRTNIQGGLMGGIYVLDFETGEIHLFYSQTQFVDDKNWSPDMRRVALDVQNSVRIVDITGENEQRISPLDYRRFIAWEGDGESVLMMSLNSIERYVFATNSREVLIEDMTISQTPELSPNGEWLAFVSESSAYTFNLKTSELVLLTPFEDKPVSATEMSWSSDSRWVTFGVLAIPATITPDIAYYVSPPTHSELIMLVDGAYANPQWSADSQQVAYTIKNDTTNLVYLGIATWDDSIAQFRQTIITSGKMLHNIRWLPDEGGWGFILNYPFGQFNFYSSHKQVYAIVHNIQAVSAFEFVR